MSKNLPKNYQNPDNKPIIATRYENFSGPLPHPEILKKYDEIVTGAAERIIKQAEVQTNHRIQLETKVIDSDIRNSRLGLIFGFIVG